MSELARTAVLGTGQVSSDDGDGTGTPVDGLVDKLGPCERERALLLRVGAAAVLQRAGKRPQTFTGTLAAAPSETLERPSTRLTELLRNMTDDGLADLLPEASAAMQKRGLRLPEEMLPVALSERALERRGFLLPILGQRGLWLARQRPEWEWAVRGIDAEATELPENATERWHEGAVTERTQLLNLARRVNPDVGRAWIESTFKADKPEQRAAWLESLEVGLTAADATLLESALSDRSATVRVTAARVLWRLPDREVAKAVHSHVTSLFPAPPKETGLLNKLKSALSKSETLRVELPPEAYDKALERLGVAEAPPHSAVGRRQWWLAQLVAGTPPMWFCDHYGATPEALIDRVRQHDFSDALVNGWASGALRFNATEWIAPLWDACFRLKGLANWFGGDTLRKLTRALHAEQRTQRLVTCLQEGAFLDLLDLAQTPWPDELARAALVRLRPETWQGRQLLALAATHLPIKQLPTSLDPLEGTSPSYVKLIENFNFKADFRRRLAEELRT